MANALTPVSALGDGAIFSSGDSGADSSKASSDETLGSFSEDCLCGFKCPFLSALVSLELGAATDGG